MRLSKIKLAGFKSFVDPTTLNLPGNLTGVVGPNGCGKSNIIDAVRWVMGESSAKHLRGATMDDVIFNGSTARKPVSMAMVELVFDNSDGKAGGQFAQYAEISAKRQVSRDGQSKYYLNGAHCRRRDIADLFLGTGLGPRSYAIIEQGMISRLIEAKPEELRVFLEEAAGISKYKERRRETETRIRHTRDNLDRLQDLREEIDKQLSHLQRQSRAAERYKEFKNEERQVKAEQLALRWRELKQKLDLRDREINETQTRLEQVIAEQRAVEAQIEQQRDQHDETNETLNKVQAQYYSLGADISGVEQNIKHQQDIQQRQQTDLQQIESTLAEASQALASDNATMTEISAQLQSDKPQLDQLKQEEEALSQRFKIAEQAMLDWQQGWDVVNQQYSEASQKAQVERSRMEQLERQVVQLKQRLYKTVTEIDVLRGEDIQEQIVELQSKLADIDSEKQAQEQQLSAVLSAIKDSREKILEAEQNSASQRRAISDDQGRLSSLEALQQAALGKTDKPVQQWLERRGLADKQRFAEQLDVATGWETAVETVLGDQLEAVCVDSLDTVKSSLSELSKSNLALIETSSANGASQIDAQLLSEKVSSALDLSDFMRNVYTAENLDEAFTRRASLQADESIITRDGIWLGRHWLRIAKDRDEKQGVLARESEIRDTQKKLKDHEAEAEATAGVLMGLREDLQAHESKREELQVELNQTHAKLNDVQAQIRARQTRHEHNTNRGQNLEAEKAETEKLIQQDSDAIVEATSNRNAALATIEQVGAQREQLESQRESLRGQLQQQRDALQSKRDSAHEIAIRIEGLSSRKIALEQNIERMQRTQEQQLQRKQELVALLSNAAEPIEVLEQQLAELLEKRLQSETALSEARHHVEEVTQLLRSLEQQRNEHEQRSEEVRNQLNQIKLDSQEIRVRSKTAEEQLAETGHSAESLLEALDENANSADWEQKMADIAQRISRLGPINLAAIDEYQETLKRKEYLDAQFKDVTSALEALEQAIAKIDKETRGRFKDTYEHVNNRLKDMFPRLFGGGSAYLEMTGDDLLSTGIAIMVKPPGKRISNIHLMSGGEKALTAVALVFAIFELNPAPFCMLDEVDAPLDEANVGRFGQLVKEMSKNVQFIYITHNKATMEISEHLSGVTMREAGVSRLVSVDVAEAATMAAV